jgi:exodeoxyribonuclease VII small subunit
MATEKKKFQDFESALARLEEITDKLESGKIRLEDSLALYSEGVDIAAQCHKQLTEAEKKIKILKEKNQALIEVPFGREDEDVD